MKGLREVCDQDGIILIFDEVITGFRVARGGAQELYGIRPTSPAWAKSSAVACRWALMAAGGT